MGRLRQTKLGGGFRGIMKGGEDERSEEGDGAGGEEDEDEEDFFSDVRSIDSPWDSMDGKEVEGVAWGG